jgi:hypothetical protein
MVWVIDDLAEAALGPWGLAVALGVGVMAATRRATGGAVVTDGDPTVIDAVPISAVSSETASTRDGVTSGVAAVPATVVAAAGRLKTQVQQVVAGTGEYWRDLFAEAHHEWEAERAGSVTTLTLVPTSDPPVLVEVEEPVAAGGKPMRGSNGRYVKETE